jgi:hypothetical protein
MYTSPHFIKAKNKGRCNVQDMFHAWGRLEMHKQFWLEYLKRRSYLKDVDINGWFILDGCKEIGWDGAWIHA